MTRPSADELIAALDLRPHPEGGFFRETYRAPLTLTQNALPRAFAGDRAASTAIYFLLTAGSFSAFHTIASDELWFFLSGDPLEVVVLPERDADAATFTRLGPPHDLFAVVPAGRTFGARLAPGGSFALVACVVAPGFDFADFALSSRDALVATLPSHLALISALTRPRPQDGAQG